MAGLIAVRIVWKGRFCWWIISPIGKSEFSNAGDEIGLRISSWAADRHNALGRRECPGSRTRAKTIEVPHRRRGTTSSGPGGKSECVSDFMSCYGFEIPSNDAITRVEIEVDG